VCSFATIVAFNELQQAEAESPMDFLPDQLINPEEYNLPFRTPQVHAIAEPGEGFMKHREGYLLCILVTLTFYLKLFSFSF